MQNNIYEMYHSHEKGLTPSEVKSRQQKYGFNELPDEKLPSIFFIFFSQFADPLIYILIFAAVVSFIVGEPIDSYFIMGVVTFNAIIGCIQEYSANRSASSLKKIVEVKTFVIRDGYEIEVLAKELVVGDVVDLKEGSKVPADIILIDADNLKVDESMLTGESLPVSKDEKKAYKEGASIQEKFNEVFAGTIVVKGHAIGIVKAIALNTEIGKIADKITQKSEAKAPLLVRMESFTIRFTLIMGVLIIIIALITLQKGMGWRETFMLASSLAVAAIPEGLPIAITITLAISMNRMASKNVIVKNLVAVEALGSCTAIASDKTGTLTINQLTIVEINTDCCGTVSLLDRVDNFIPLQNEKSFKNMNIEKKILMTFVLPNEASEKDGKFYGDPVDIAFLKTATSKGYNIKEIHEKYERLELLPYTSEDKFSASFNRVDGKFTYAFVKGAPETIIEMCNRKNLNETSLKERLDYLTKKGLRVLAVACGEVKPKSNPEDYKPTDLKGLDFLGLVAMLDPLRPEAAQAVRECQDAGINVIMITGDNPKTAFAISSQLGFVNDQSQVVTGADLKKASAVGLGAFDKITEKAKVYARVEPTQKLDIVQSLIRNGNFVAVTGDAVNDAPALKNANVGIAMGKSGTDIAKESASIIITDDNFASIVHGVEEGRLAYSNIRKLIFFLVSTAFAEIGIFIMCIIFKMPLPFLALQLLWINLITEGIQGIALAMEKAEGTEMTKPPRKPDEPIFNTVMLSRIIITSIVMIIGCFTIFTLDYKLTGDVVRARSLSIFLLILFQNMQIFNARSEDLSIFKQSFSKNPFLFISIGTVTFIHIAVSYIPSFGKYLKIVPLSSKEMLSVAAIAFSIIIVMEMEKKVRGFLIRKIKR